MLHTRPRPMKSRQGIPKESSVFVSFVSDTSVGQHEFSKSESAYAELASYASSSDVRICGQWQRVS